MSITNQIPSFQQAPNVRSTFVLFAIIFNIIHGLLLTASLVSFKETVHSAIYIVLRLPRSMLIGSLKANSNVF